MRLATGVSSGSGAQIDNLRLPGDLGKLWIVGGVLTADFAVMPAPGRQASIARRLTASRYDVFTNTVKSCNFRRLGRRLVRIIHPDRSELASA